MLWYERSGTPSIAVSGTYDKKKCSYSLTFKQISAKSTKDSSSSESNYATVPFHIPIKIGLITDKGPIPISDDNNNSLLIELTKKQETITFENINKCPTPSLLQGFTAPIKLDFSYSEKDLILLMSEDLDGFSCWNACQELAIRVMTVMQHEYRLNKKLEMKSYLYDAFLGVMNRPNKDKAMQALLLTIPSELIMAEISNEIDIEAIHIVRDFVLSELGKNLSSYWNKIYKSNLTSKKYIFNAKETSQRSLKNLALRYIVSSKSEGSLKTVENQIIKSNNMTDRLAALNILVNDNRKSAIDLSKKYLNKFYQDYKDEPLVLNQWFQVQASCSLPGGLNRVRTLMEHPAFDFNNPNKIRSLIGVFCTNNPMNFHCDRGDGYEFLADQVLALDRINPQIAARLLNPLTRWRKFPKKRRNLMKNQLSRIILENDLSGDTYEIASKSLS